MRRRRKFHLGGRPHSHIPPDYSWSDPGIMTSCPQGTCPDGTCKPCAKDPWMDQVQGGKGSRRLRNFRSHGGVKRRGGRIYAGGGQLPYDLDYSNQFSSGLNPYRRGGRVFGGGGAAYGQPNSCIDGRTGRNVPCM